MDSAPKVNMGGPPIRMFDGPAEKVADRIVSRKCSREEFMSWDSVG